MPLNRFYLTEAGWVAAGPLSSEAEPWSERIARDVMDISWRAQDETAVSPPLAVMAEDSPLPPADAMAKPLSAMASGIFMYLPSGG